MLSAGATGIAAALVLMLLTMPPALSQSSAAPAAQSKACPSQTELKLPPGFCASVFADGIGHARHLVVAPDGVVYVNTWSGRYYGNDKTPDGGFLVALQDTKGTGHADVTERFGETVDSGGAGGTGISWYKNFIYAEINDRIVRYALQPGSIVPKGPPEVIVSGLPLTGDHPMHPFAIDADGQMYVDVASATNACQEKNRIAKSPGIDPCTELQTRAGIWRYDANKTSQHFSPAERFATGIRNADGIAVDGTGRGIYATQHGRDQLAENWPDLYKPEQGATLPSEELLRIKQGGDYGWPKCYYDPGQHKLVLAPEYGGDGGKATGSCTSRTGPVAAFPAHWAPNDLMIYSGKQLPARYQGGAFIAFHGSWNRAPFAQDGYNVVFQSLADGSTADGSGRKCEIFADGFAGAIKTPQKAAHRPSGLAAGADGAIYVSDDVRGRIYKITYSAGGTGAGGASQYTPCPSLTALPASASAGKAVPPEGIHPDAGKAAKLPIPKGATKETVALGARIYSGQVAGATCTGCHGSDGAGTPLGPDLTDDKWLWSDGSVAGIQKTITAGVPEPKQYRSPMPPMGGSQLTPEQVSALAAYVWGLSHH
jgi:glucose/arabinose dehydrogenase/mono/diheme cytochrome c family protein